MNILKRELKSGIKPFIFWTLGLFVLIFAGVVKSTGATADASMLSELTASFPRIVMAVMGMIDVDLGTFGGFYSVLAQYALILTAVYAVYLGSNAVTRESIDKTYEFVFTKPRSRSFILLNKLLAGVCFLSIYSLLSFLFSVAAVAVLALNENMTAAFALFALSQWVVGLVFFSLAMMFSTVLKHAEKGIKLGNLAVSICFAVGLVCDMLDNAGILRILSPLKYFTPNDLLAGNFSLPYLLVCAVLVAISLFTSLRQFEKRDLTAA